MVEKIVFLKKILNVLDHVLLFLVCSFVGHLGVLFFTEESMLNYFYNLVFLFNKHELFIGLIALFVFVFFIEHVIRKDSFSEKHFDKFLYACLICLFLLISFSKDILIAIVVLIWTSFVILKILEDRLELISLSDEKI